MIFWSESNRARVTHFPLRQNIFWKPPPSEYFRIAVFRVQLSSPEFFKEDLNRKSIFWENVVVLRYLNRRLERFYQELSLFSLYNGVNRRLIKETRLGFPASLCISIFKKHSSSYHKSVYTLLIYITCLKTEAETEKKILISAVKTTLYI